MKTSLRFLAALALALLLFAPARAQTAAPITVLKSEARPNFPTAIVFDLTAEAADADITAVQLLYGPTRSEELTVVDLPVGAGRRVEASHSLDTQAYQVPPGIELTYRWVLRDAAGAELTTEPQTILYEDDRFTWRERKVGLATVFWYRGGDDFGQELADVTASSLERLQREIGASLDRPVRIYVYADTRDMRAALEANSEEWIGGQARPDLGLIIGAIAPGDSYGVKRLIPHELSHQVLHQATDNPYGGMPVWFNEGLAVHNQEARDADYGPLVLEVAREGRLIPLEALGASFPADPDQTTLSYAQSREVVEYILATYGEAKLGELVAAFAEGATVDEVLPAVLGRTVDELDAEWRATLPAQVAAPTTEAGPATAPPDRFEGAPAGDPAAPDAPAFDLLRWLVGLPAWAPLAAMALCCVAGVGAAGAALLMGLRLLGVDKRTS